MKTEKAVEIVKVIVTSEKTKEESRISPNYFTRNRALPFSDLLYFLLNPGKECLQVRLNNFFKEIGKREMTISQQAVSKARSHFDHSPFEKMARRLVEIEYGGDYELERWNGYHVFGVDGSSVNLPNTPELREAFGFTSGSGDICASAGMSILYDVLHDWVIDASLNRYPLNERTAAKEHIRVLQDSFVALSNILILFDRGYPSQEMLNYLQNSGIKYLMRCQKSWLSEVERAPTGDSVIVLRDGLTLRVFKFLLSSGEEETLVTNLFEIPHEELPKLYFLRWNIEGKYDVLKNKIQLENVSGYSKNVILQDFWASMTLANLVAIAKKEADELIQKKCENKNNRRKQIPNVSQLVGSLKNDFILACMLPSDALCSIEIDRIIKQISKAVTTVRPDRPPRPRKILPKKKLYPINRKSNI